LGSTIVLIRVKGRLDPFLPFYPRVKGRLDPFSRELPEVVNQSVQEMMQKLTGKDITLCPCCGKGKMHPVCLIPEGTGPSGYDILHPSG
jgi:hypothetical protein